jgi:uncharacterized protein (TIGR04255 family)
MRKGTDNLGSLPPPLGGPAPAEILLSRAPLVHVVLQVRFSSVLKIDSREGMAPFQEEVRSEYPLLEQAAVQQLQMELGSGAPFFRPATSNLWRFSDADRCWILSLTSDAVTLETRRYDGRADFLSRWYEALAHVERIFAPSLALRLGVRYVNRIHGESLEELTEWIIPNLIGVAQPELREHVSQAISEANVTVEEGALLLRWGVLAAGMTIDPTLLEPAPVPSWILDIDVSSAEQRSFSGDGLATAFQALADRAYSVFRYAVTSAGLEHFGAQP